jgi:peptidoglycan-associated lipoprotein
MKLKALAILASSVLLAACGSDTPEPSQVVCVQPGSAQDFCQNVGDRVFFDFDRSVVNPCGQETLQRQAAWLCKYGYKVTILGNCDERGSTDYNLALGARRANAARKCLISNGVPASQIEVCSMGKEKPIAQGNNEAAWAENRNAITLLCATGGNAPIANMEAPVGSETVANAEMPAETAVVTESEVAPS